MKSENPQPVDNEISFTPFEPKVNNRFLVYMDKIPIDIIHKVVRPFISVSDGKYNYSDLMLYIWDPIHPSSSQILTNLERDGVSTFDKIVLKILGPIGDEVECWIYKNCKIEHIRYPVLDWRDSSPSSIEIRISFETVVHEF